MRRAEEIIYNHYGCRSWEEVCKDFLTDVSPSMIKEIVVQAQIGAIEETCKRCAENVTVECTEAVGIGGMYLFGIDKKSILKVADKMKEELE